MSIDPNSRDSTISPAPEVPQQELPPEVLPDGASNSSHTREDLAKQDVASLEHHSQQQLATAAQARLDALQQQTAKSPLANPRASLITLLAVALIIAGLVFNNFLIGVSGTLLALLLSLAVLIPWLQRVVNEWFSPQERSLFVAFLGVTAALVGLFQFSGLYQRLINWGRHLNWDAVGPLAEWFGALGQILIAVIAVYVAWRQYVISKDLTIQQNMLTIQQNLITQQQTIDSYFQGISDLVLDEEGLLEDWPQERAIAEGRTAAILSSVDAGGKAKIIRFLSRSRLLTPLKRDRRLGRAIFNGTGGYAEDRLEGVRVIDLGVMLAGADLSETDLRWTDLSEANLIRANLSRCDLVKTNLSRTILYDAQLVAADLKGIRLFYGSAETTTPRSRMTPPDYKTGAHTGAVVENADFTDAQRMSEAVRYYCCTWGGAKTRATIPGGCEGIPDQLGH